MKLSELVNLHNQLSQFDLSAIKQSTQISLDTATTLSNDQQLEDIKSELLKEFDRFGDRLQQYLSMLHDQIRDLERPYLLESYKIYEMNRQIKYEWFYMDLPNDLPAKFADQYDIREKNVRQQVDNILSKKLDITTQGLEVITNRILKNANWQSTTMVIHPNIESWMPNLVSNDPLYLVDESHDLIAPTLSLFNQTYQNRLRVYTVKEDQKNHIMSSLPDEQFGLIVAWNYFNYRPFEIIRTYLNELYNKLRPGGILMMTFNDCDRWKGVLAAENKSALYTPGFLIRSFATRLGFEEIFCFDEDGPWTWIELRKPGKWHSLRGGQALAKIKPK